jgi:hypothetical protein
MNFEIAANLANLVGVSAEADITDRVRAQIDYLKMWADLNAQKKLLR